MATEGGAKQWLQREGLEGGAEQWRATAYMAGQWL